MVKNIAFPVLGLQFSIDSHALYGVYKLNLLNSFSEMMLSCKLVLCIFGETHLHFGSIIPLFSAFCIASMALSYLNPVAWVQETLRRHQPPSKKNCALLPLPYTKSTPLHLCHTVSFAQRTAAAR